MPPSNTPEFSFSLITYDIEVGKTYSRNPDGSIRKTTEGNGFNGQFATYTLSSMGDLWALQEGMTTRQCLIAGVSYIDDEWGTLGSGLHDHKRTKLCFPEPTDHALATLDIDLEHCPFPLPTAEHVKAMLVWLVPQLARAALIVRPSSSAGVEGQVGGWHVHVLAPPGQRVEVMDRLSAEFARRGVAWIYVTDFPALTERTPVDRALRIPNQPIYSAKPRVAQDVRWDRPEGIVQEGCAFDPEWLSPDKDVSAVFARLKETPEVQQRRAEVIASKAEARVPAGTKDRPKALQKAKEAIEREVMFAKKGELPADFEIQIHNGPRVTVAEILKGGMAYHLAKTLTPGEEGYRDGAQTGIIYMNGTPRLHTQAHGGIDYRLLGGEDPTPPKPFDMQGFLAGFNVYHQRTQEVSLQVGRERVTRAVSKFFDELPNALAIRATPGVGKTHAVISAIAARDHLKVLYLVPNHALSGQVLADIGEESAAIRYGRSPDNCMDHENMRLFQQRSGPRAKTARDYCGNCPFRDQCKYFADIDELKDKRVVVASHAFLFMDHGISGWKPDVIVVDEFVQPYASRILKGKLRPWSTAEEIDAESDAIRRDALTAVTMPEGTPTERTAKAKALGELAYRSAIVMELRGEGRHRVQYDSHTDELTLFVDRENIYPDTPTLFIDGTARKELVDIVAGRPVPMECVNVARQGTATQITGRGFTKASYSAEKVGQLKPYTDRIAASAALVAPLLAKLALGFKDRPLTTHHGATAGLNAMKDCEELVVFRPLDPPLGAVVGATNYLSHKQGIDPPCGLARRVQCPVFLSDGALAYRSLRTYDHPIADALHRNSTMDWAEQACDRNRRVSADHNLTFLGGDLLPFVFDKEVAWKDAVAGRSGSKIQEALNTGNGLVAKSHKSAHKVRPDIWASEGSAKRNYANEPEGWQDDLEEVAFTPLLSDRPVKALRRRQN